MGFFDFLGKLPAYADQPMKTRRLDVRRDFIVSPFRGDLIHARVLDLASHDGRWAYALADTGASFVHGIEGRQDLIDQFADFPNTTAKAKTTLKHGDVFAHLEQLIHMGVTYDVVACYGFFYHITDHYRLLTLLHHLRPKLIIIDSEFMTAEVPVVVFGREKVDNPLNSIARVPGQNMAMVGTPSRRWIWSAALTLGYQIEWVDWGRLPHDQRAGVRDYFRKGDKRRGTVALRPISPQ